MVSLRPLNKSGEADFGFGFPSIPNTKILTGRDKLYLNRCCQSPSKILSSGSVKSNFSGANKAVIAPRVAEVLANNKTIKLKNNNCKNLGFSREGKGAAIS